jgi:hypothetical protein
VTSTETPDAPESTLLSGETPPATHEGAPEAYGDFKPVEGSTLDKAAIDAASPLFKEMNLTQDQAQKLVDLYGKLSKDSRVDFDKQVRETRSAWKADSQKWLDANGGADSNKQNIGKALNIIFDNDTKAIGEFRHFMDYTVAGDNPSFVRAFSTMAKAFVEGKAVQGSGPSEHGQTEPGRNERPSLAQSIYGPDGPRRGPYRPNQSQPQSG